MPSVKTDPAGAPLTVMLLIDSEPSASAIATATSRAMGLSSNPLASDSVTSGASATPATLISKLACESDQTSPSETLKSNEVEPDQSACGSKVRRPCETSYAEISSPALTATPSSSRVPLVGSDSMRKVAAASPVSTSADPSEMTAVSSSSMSIEPSTATGGSLTGLMCTSRVAAPVVVSPLSASTLVAEMVRVKSWS